MLFYGRTGKWCLYTGLLPPGKNASEKKRRPEIKLPTSVFTFSFCYLVIAVASGTALGIAVLGAVFGVAARSVLAGLRSAAVLAAVLRIVLRTGVVCIVCVVRVVRIIRIVCHNL